MNEKLTQEINKTIQMIDITSENYYRSKSTHSKSEFIEVIQKLNQTILNINDKLNVDISLELQKLIGGFQVVLDSLENRDYIQLIDYMEFVIVLQLQELLIKIK